MKRIPWKVAAEVEAEQPSLAELVKSAGLSRKVVLRLEDFANTRQFYNAVWFALSYGVRVIIEDKIHS